MRTLLLAVATVLAMVACGEGAIDGTSTSPPDEAPYLTGVVTDSQVAAGADALGTLLVEEEPGVQSGNKASATVTPETLLLREIQDAFARTDYTSVARADLVSVWFDGAVAESYPVQGTASAVGVHDG